MKIPRRLRLLWRRAHFLIHGNIPPRPRPPKLCAECKKPNDYYSWSYMVTDLVWTKADLSYREICCLPCLQKRLGRPLELEDFPLIPANRMIRWGIRQGQLEEMRENTKATP